MLQYIIQDVRRLHTRYLKFNIEFHIKYLIFDTVYFDNFIFLIVTLYSLMRWFNSYIVLNQFIAIFKLYIISFIKEIRFTILKDIRFYIDHRNLKKSYSTIWLSILKWKMSRRFLRLSMTMLCREIELLIRKTWNET